MGYMGLETPIEMPSMGIYNTDLMKMYIAGVKDQYEKGQEEMKDFMKAYGDFYSDIPGATEAYNNMTIGGARNMINQMLANGIDPYKSPEARAAISRYIASVPTWRLNEMKRSAENAALYKKALAEAQNNPNFDADYNRAMIGGDLETWDPNKPWTATAPYIAPSVEESFKPYMEKFKQSEILESDRPGYIKLGTTDENQQGALRAALQNYENTPYGQFKRQQAEKIAANTVNPDGTPLTPEQRAALAQSIFEQPAKDYARQFFQPAYEDDWKAKADYQAKLNARYSRSGGGGGDRSTSTGGYLAIHDAITRGIASKIQTQWGDIEYSSYQKGIMNNSKSPLKALNAMSFDVSPTLYSSFMGRTALNGSSNTVGYESGDAGNMYSASEIYAKMQGRPSGFKPTSYGKIARAHMKNAYVSDAINGVTKTATGKGVAVLEDDGLVHVYLQERARSTRSVGNDDNKKNQISTDIMYTDTGYRYDPETWEVDQNLSINAIARDAAATKKVYNQDLMKLKN